MDFTKEDFIRFHENIINLLKAKYQAEGKEIPKYLEEESGMQIPIWVYRKNKKPSARERQWTIPDLYEESADFKKFIETLPSKKDISAEEKLENHAKSFGRYIYDKLVLPFFREKNPVDSVKISHTKIKDGLFTITNSSPANSGQRKKRLDSTDQILFLGFYLSAVEYTVRTLLLKITPDTSQEGTYSAALFGFHNPMEDPAQAPEYTGIARYKYPNFFANLDNLTNGRQLNIIGAVPAGIKNTSSFHGSIQGVSNDLFLISGEAVFHKITEAEQETLLQNNLDPARSKILDPKDYTTLCLYLRLKRNIFKVPFDLLEDYKELSTRGIRMADFSELLANKSYLILHFGRDQSQIFKSTYEVDGNLNGILRTYEETLKGIDSNNNNIYESKVVSRKCTLTISTIVQDRICITAYADDRVRRHITSFAIFDLQAKTSGKYYAGVFSSVGNNDGRGPACGHLVIKEESSNQEAHFKPEIFSRETAAALNSDPEGHLYGFLDLLLRRNNPTKFIKD